MRASRCCFAHAPSRLRLARSLQRRSVGTARASCVSSEVRNRRGRTNQQAKHKTHPRARSPAQRRMHPRMAMLRRSVPAWLALALALALVLVLALAPMLVVMQMQMLALVALALRHPVTAASVSVRVWPARRPRRKARAKWRRHRPRQEPSILSSSRRLLRKSACRERGARRECCASTYAAPGLIESACMFQTIWG